MTTSDPRGPWRAHGYMIVLHAEHEPRGDWGAPAIRTLGLGSEKRTAATIAAAVNGDPTPAGRNAWVSGRLVYCGPARNGLTTDWAAAFLHEQDAARAARALNGASPEE